MREGIGWGASAVEYEGKENQGRRPVVSSGRTKGALVKMHPYPSLFFHYVELR